MGVCIGCIGFAVRGPAGVSNTSTSADVLFLAEGFQVGHLAFSFVHVESALIINHSYTGAVITTVFQSLESFN